MIQSDCERKGNSLRFIFSLAAGFCFLIDTGIYGKVRLPPSSRHQRGRRKVSLLAIIYSPLDRLWPYQSPPLRSAIKFQQFESQHWPRLPWNSFRMMSLTRTNRATRSEKLFDVPFERWWKILRSASCKSRHDERLMRSERFMDCKQSAGRETVKSLWDFDLSCTFRALKLEISHWIRNVPSKGEDFDFFDLI